MVVALMWVCVALMWAGVTLMLLGVALVPHVQRILFFRCECVCVRARSLPMCDLTRAPIVVCEGEPWTGVYVCSGTAVRGRGASLCGRSTAVCGRGAAVCGRSIGVRGRGAAVCGVALMCVGVVLLCVGVTLMCVGVVLLCVGVALMCVGVALMCVGVHRTVLRHQSAVRVQARFKGWIGHREYKRKLRACIVLQAHVRGMYDRRFVHHLRRTLAATVVQTSFRAHAARTRYHRLVDTARALQQYARRCLARADFAELRQESAAARIQSLYVALACVHGCACVLMVVVSFAHVWPTPFSRSTTLPRTDRCWACGILCLPLHHAAIGWCGSGASSVPPWPRLCSCRRVFDASRHASCSTR